MTWIRAKVLTVLDAADGPLHGYGVAKAIGNDVHSSTVYSELNKLVIEALVTATEEQGPDSVWVTPRGPQVRRQFAITDRGRRIAHSPAVQRTIAGPPPPPSNEKARQAERKRRLRAAAKEAG